MEDMKEFGIFGAAVVLILVLKVCILWVLLSGVTSGIKALSDDCGKRYGVEAVLGGDWFCPEP